MLKKLKSIILDDTIYIGFLLVLVGVSSFGLGRMEHSISDNKTTALVQSVGLTASLSDNPLKVGSNSATTTPEIKLATPQSETAANFVASKSGTKYHKLTCGGAKNIKDSNKIYFVTEAEAQAAGYTQAANCQF